MVWDGVVDICCFCWRKFGIEIFLDGVIGVGFFFMWEVGVSNGVLVVYVDMFWFGIRWCLWWGDFVSGDSWLFVGFV